MASSGQNQNKALSSAAAAAALRARPHTPTNVAQVQTKRTMRRSPSVSSSSSAPIVGRSELPRLERRGSSASMTERTFRTPSPHGERRPAPEHPPVPAIPAGHRVSRSTSSAGVGMQNFKTASQKMDAGMPSWYTAPTGDTKNVRTSDAPMTSTPKARPESIASIQRPDSRSSSVNFSYPASGSSSTMGTLENALVYDPNSRRMVPKVDTEATEHRVREAAYQQPKKKKATSGGVQRSGSHLAKGTVARVKGSTVEPSGQQHDPPRREQHVAETQHRSDGEMQMPDDTADDVFITTPQRKQKGREVAQHVRQPEQQDQRLSTPSPVPEGTVDPERIASPRPTRVTRKPSVVREEPEEEEGGVASEIVQSREAMNALDAVPTRTSYEQPPAQPLEGARASGLKPHPVDHTQPWTHSHAHPEPVTSPSPVRQARFANVSADKLMVRHAPLPRSASPIKSALKYRSPSPRDASPSDHSSEAARGSRLASPEREPPLPRKKSVRVSFDDRGPEVVGESTGLPDDYADSPVLQSTQQTKRPWYSNISRSKKKDIALEDDEVMKPRAALPSFASVREKKLREPEQDERPLIRPHEPVQTTPAPASPVIRPCSPGEAAADQSEKAEPTAVGQSNDHAIGSILAQDQTARGIEANTSRFREPLPPVVTSLEGNGDLSDSDRNSDKLFNSAGDDSDVEAIPSTQTTNITVPESQANSLNGSMILEEKIPAEAEKPSTEQRPTELPVREVPSITVMQPSPAATEETMATNRRPARPYFGIPGMFPEDDSDDGPTAQDAVVDAEILAVSANAMKEPEAEIQPSQTQSLPQTTLATTPHQTIDDNYLAWHADQSDRDSVSNASIYSDAYEDLSEAEGDGFQSLNAVVESPVTKAPMSELHDANTWKQAASEDNKPTVQHPAAQISFPAQPSGIAQSGDDWEQAKSYWRSLTTDKRRQLEQEATEDAGADGDHEELRTPTRKLSNRTKKTAEQRLATSVSQMAKAQAAAPSARSKPARPVNPERVYQIQPGSRATHEGSPTTATGRMRASMRDVQPAKPAAVTKSAPGEVHMRKSMRTNTGGDDRSSRRVSTPPERVVPTSTTTSKLKAATGPGDDASHRSRTTSHEVAASAATASSRSKPQAPRRRGSDASDSSFKRSRGAPTEGFNFRRTMRQDTAPQASPKITRDSGRFSLRSTSPAASPFRRTSTNITSGSTVAGSMRQTLRSDRASIRSNESRRSSIQFPSFGRSSKAKKPAKQSSRFGDSSDEDDRTSNFPSRFDDSSDEDNVRPSSSSRPLSKGTLRGSATAPAAFKNVTAPVPEEDERSEDLRDSDEETQMPSPMQSPRGAAAFRPTMGTKRASSGIGTSTLKRSGSGSAAIVSSPTMPPPTQRRASFMSNILRRNKKADGKITRSELMDSAARRDTKLERDSNQLKMIRDSQPASPKLQKRNQVSRSESWPLPEFGDDGRPNTAGDLVTGAGPTRPAFAGRRSTSLGLPGLEQQQQQDVVDGVDGVPQKRKKKFGALRRMFRLDD
ncbi:hypothetical protein BJ170DRAFT_727090 [Xylariales sp. AK1849]|nr:hypothetical protein BJ170DRAFT_727090 [Xylariales sp. AK1849]